MAYERSFYARKKEKKKWSNVYSGGVLIFHVYDRWIIRELCLFYTSIICFTLA